MRRMTSWRRLQSKARSMQTGVRQRFSEGSSAPYKHHECLSIIQLPLSCMLSVLMAAGRQMSCRCRALFFSACSHHGILCCMQDLGYDTAVPIYVNRFSSSSTCSNPSLLMGIQHTRGIFNTRLAGPCSSWRCRVRMQSSTRAFRKQRAGWLE